MRSRSFAWSFIGSNDLESESEWYRHGCIEAYTRESSLFLINRVLRIAADISLLIRKRRASCITHMTAMWWGSERVAVTSISLGLAGTAQLKCDKKACSWVNSGRWRNWWTSKCCGHRRLFDFDGSPNKLVVNWHCLAPWGNWICHEMLPLFSNLSTKSFWLLHWSPCVPLTWSTTNKIDALHFLGGCWSLEPQRCGVISNGCIPVEIKNYGLTSVWRLLSIYS